MDVLEVLIETQQLPNAIPASAQYTFGTSSTNPRMAVRGLKLINTAAIVQTFSIHHVRSGDVPSGTNYHFDAATIQPKTTVEIGYDRDEWLLQTGDEIWAFSNGNNVNIYMAGEGTE